MGGWTTSAKDEYGEGNPGKWRTWNQGDNIAFRRGGA